MALRDHDPIIIEQFEGWWDRGDDESAPSDHFIVADNVQYFNSGVETRDPLDKYQTIPAPLTAILRVYNYVMQTSQSLLVLTEGGKIYHCVGPATVHGPILTIPTMEDFGFVAIAGRAYITPFKTNVDTLGQNYELGLPGEFVYVYKGDGTLARKAAGNPPSNATGTPSDGGKKPLTSYNSVKDGKITVGVHVLTVCNGGGPGSPDMSSVVFAPGDKMIQLDNIPLGPVGMERQIVMTKAIPANLYVGDPLAYNGQYYLVHTILGADSAATTFTLDIADSEFPASPMVPTATPAGTATGSMQIFNTVTVGFNDPGFRIIGAVYETDTGYLTSPGPEFYAKNTIIDEKKAIMVKGIPTSPDAFVVKRHLVSTKVLMEYNGDQKGYQFFFIPKGTLEDNTTTELLVNYYDSDLIADASHLMDNYSAIPAGVNLNTYHGRMILVGDPSFPKKLDGTIDTTKPDNRSVAWVSAPGEPEAINQVDGLLITPLDGNPLTNVQEFRDVLYLFKKTRTYAYSDNQDEPATWSSEVLDQGVGAPVHGIGTVLDSGGVNTDFLLIADWSGLMLFNGTYARPEMTWKIEDYWMSIVRNDFRYIQLVNDSLSKKIWMTLPPPNQHVMLHADYGNGLDAKNIRWARWTFDAKISCIALVETTKLVLGAVANAV